MHLAYGFPSLWLVLPALYLTVSIFAVPAATLIFLFMPPDRSGKSARLPKTFIFCAAMNVVLVALLYSLPMEIAPELDWMDVGLITLAAFPPIALATRCAWRRRRKCC